MSDAPAIQTCRWHEISDGAALRDVVVARILAASERAVRARGRFTVVLAGGQTPRGVYETLRTATADWPAWHVYFGDERCAPRDDPLRNSRMADETWLSHVPIPTGQVHEIPAELGPADAAKRYARTLVPAGTFDLVLLGLGEDGHTASLFPGHAWGSDAASPSALPVLAAPKPPPERVTLSARRLSDAAEVIFLVSGAGKRDAVRRWRAGESIPAGSIAPPQGVDVFVDTAALPL